MTLVDIDLLERSLGYYKIKYDDLDKSYVKDDKQVLKKYVVPINLTPFLQNVYELYNQFEDKKNFEFHSAIAITNIIAHYKHYYSARLQSKNATIIVYVNSKKVYKNNKDILDKIKRMTDFFPNILFLDDIFNRECDITHGIYSICNLIQSYASSHNYDTIIHVYSYNTIDYQLLFATKSEENRLIKMLSFNKKIYTKKALLEKIFGNDFYEESLYKNEIDTMIIPIALYMNTIVKGENPLFNIKGSSKKTRLTTLRNYLKDNVGKTDCDLIVGFGDTLTDFDKPKYIEYVKENDYHLNKQVITIVKSLYNSLNSKIKDYDALKEDDKVRLLRKHNLNLNWLMF